MKNVYKQQLNDLILAHAETEKSRRALKFASYLFGEDSTTIRDISVTVVENLGAELEAKRAFLGCRRP